ncbi:MAG TPA: extracellular solute-binding protein [Herbaspirillum sp.]|jgi:iron(III) transport system substrate-binding protein
MTSSPRTRRVPFALAALASACIGFFAAMPAIAQTASLMQYEGADRTEKLIAGAAKEDNTLTLYTAFRPEDLPAILAPFEKKYGIKVKPWRSGSDNVTQRVLSEAAGKRFEADAIMMPAQDMEAVRREHLLQPVKSPFQKDLAKGALPNHREYASVLLNVVVQAYNPTVLKKEDLPKTFEDLTDPKWKGKLGIEAKAEEWYTTVVNSRGEQKGIQMFHDIVQNNGISVRLGMSLLHNLVLAREVPLSLTMYIDLAEKSKRAGKPIDWFSMDPAVAQGFNIGLARQSPHPDAALLFYDYMLSPETQQLLASKMYYPASAKVASPYPELAKTMKFVDPVYTVDNYEKWSKSYRDVVTNQAGGKAK